MFQMSTALEKIYFPRRGHEIRREINLQLLCLHVLLLKIFFIENCCCLWITSAALSIFLNFSLSLFSARQGKKKENLKITRWNFKSFSFCSHRLPKSIFCSLNINKKFCTNIKFHIWIIQWHFFPFFLYLLTL